MSKRNGLSDTKEMPIPTLPPEEPVQRYDQQPQRANPNAPHRNPQDVRQVRQNPRQRLQQPAPHAAIRRASYQDRLPEDEKTMPYRRPPQQTRRRDDESEKAPRKKKKRRKRSKFGCLQRAAVSMICVLIAIFALYSCVALFAIKQIAHEETGSRQITSQIAENDPDIRNLLLIGTDSRAEERGRADTIILLSFSKHNRTMTITSLMRDSYVSIPNHGTDKLNAAYAYGGATLLMDTIVNNFGIQIDDYICINFKAFVHTADALGGIKVEVSDREAEAINIILQSEVNEIMGDDPMADFLPSGGTFVLNGKQALAYARIRYVGNADFERTERQRMVLDLLLDKMKHLNPLAVPKILGSALPELSSNISSSSMYLMSLELPLKLIAYDMQKLRLPADGTFSDQTAADGQMVLAVDFDANRELYQHAMYDAVAPNDAETE